MFTWQKVRTKGAAWAPRLAIPAGIVAAGLLLAPVKLAIGAPIYASRFHIALTLVLTLLGFAAAFRFQSVLSFLTGLILVPLCLWLFTWTGYPGGVEVIATVYGASLGLVFAWFIRPMKPFRPRPWFVAVAPAFMLLCGAFAIFWTGSTAPKVAWFGALESHGPRDKPYVALTFDDGPNPGFTLQVAEILDAHGVKGTFFEVGKAVKLHPEITAALFEDGQVVGNHSYYHGAFSYLDPRYPELDRAEREFANDAGFCPALFRPPHGTHTPFMSRKVTNQGMTLVTWDVSAKDWISQDAAKLTQDVLDHARPGSIILLHDGDDGNIPSNRSVLIEALPGILDGLAARGLTPVTLDKLLNVPAYLSSEACSRFRLSSEATVSLRPDVVESQSEKAGNGR